MRRRLLWLDRIFLKTTLANCPHSFKVLPTNARKSRNSKYLQKLKTRKWLPPCYRLLSHHLSKVFRALLNSKIFPSQDFHHWLNQLGTHQPASEKKLMSVKLPLLVDLQIPALLEEISRQIKFSSVVQYVTKRARSLLSVLCTPLSQMKECNRHL